MQIRRALALALALFFLMLPGSAFAWQEAHEIGDDASIRVDSAGVASVRHSLRWHVVRGPLKWVDLAGVDAAAAIEPEVPVVADDGRVLAARAVRRDEKTVRVTFDDPRGMSRGSYTLDVRWRVDLATTLALAPDATMWRLTYAAPAAIDGFDTARVTFNLPAAPDPPQPIAADTGLVDDSAVTTLHREASEDTLEIVRPHVGRGEALTLALRVDPRLMPGVVDPRLRPPKDVAPQAEAPRPHAAVVFVALAGLGVLFGVLVTRRGRAFEESCVRAGGTARGLLPVPPAVRGAVGGCALAVGAGLLVYGNQLAAAPALFAATIATGLSNAGPRPRARGPGRWLALRPEDAFAAPSGGIWEGRRAPAAVVALGALSALLAHPFDENASWSIVLASVPFVALFIVGTGPPPPSARTTPWLSRLFRRLRLVPALRVSPWARIASGAATAEELRLLVLPRAAMPGLVGVEVGLAWSSTPVGWAATPEVLTRVLDGSAAALRMARELPCKPATLGRRADERVVRLYPRVPTQRAAAALIRALVDTLTDRRLGGEPWSGEERRIPLAPSHTSAPSAAAA